MVAPGRPTGAMGAGRGGANRDWGGGSDTGYMVSTASPPGLGVGIGRPLKTGVIGGPHGEGILCGVVATPVRLQTTYHGE